MDEDRTKTIRMQRFSNRWALAITGLSAIVIGVFYARERIAMINEGLGPIALNAEGPTVFDRLSSGIRRP